ncbi:hypothetical protein Tco_0880770 [Tanacetum coccineum]
MLSVTPKPASVEVSDESDAKPVKRYWEKKNAAEEEATRQVHATHEWIVTESDLKPTRRRPSGIAFRDTSSVSKKILPDLSQKLKGIQTLTTEEQLAADMMQALKANKKFSKSQPHAGGSSKGTGTKLGVPDESTIILTTSHEGTGTKPGVPDEVQGSSAAKADVTLDWGSENENDVDEEMKDAKVGNTRKSDEEITDTAKACAEKIEEVKDDNKKAKFPPSSSNLFVSSGFGNQFLNLSSNKSTIGNLKDTTDAEINSLLEVQIQQEIPHIQSPSILTILVSVIPEPTFLSPIHEILIETPAKTLPPSPSLNEVDHTTILLASLRSDIPSAVNAYLGSSLRDALQKSMLENVINEVKNLLPKFLPKAVSDFATLVIQSTVKKALEKNPIVLAQSSSQAQFSLMVAESLIE